MSRPVNILLLGRGGRESAIAWWLLQSPGLGRLYTAPAQVRGAIQATGLDPTDFEAVADFVRRHDISMVLAADPELIVMGLADALRECGADVLVPSGECARLEGSKEFAKEFMAENMIPTPRCMPVTADTLAEGLAFMESRTPPYVLKADGLTDGRGVLIVDNLADAKDALADMLDGLFGEASRTVLIEEWVPGPECTLTVVCDGTHWLILPTVRDYKRLHDGDNGPNTGGMGAVSPVAWVDSDFIAKAERLVVRPTFEGLMDMGTPYVGFLYFGLKSDHGEPVLLEYNARPGDPEMQALLPRMECDPVGLLESIAKGTLDRYPLNVSPRAAVAVVVTAPVTDEPEEVSGIDEARAAGTLVFGGNIWQDALGRRVTTGGRVLTVTALGGNVPVAAMLAREGASMIDVAGRHYRSDIGLIPGSCHLES